MRSISRDKWLMPITVALSVELLKKLDEKCEGNRSKFIRDLLEKEFVKK